MARPLVFQHVYGMLKDRLYDSGAITVGSDVEHIYAIRQDSASACAPLITRYPMLSPEKVSAIQEAYRAFRKNILRLMSSYSPYSEIRLHTFKAQGLHQRLYAVADELKSSQDCVKLSLDFLIEGSAQLEISRLMSVGGKNRLGYTVRPGAPSIKEQVQKINTYVCRHYNGEKPVSIVLLEDNVRARSLSMVRLAKDLLTPVTSTGRAKIDGVATCFMVADNHEAEKNLDMAVKPVVQYKLCDEEKVTNDIVQKLDVITVRDFALLFDGYAVMLQDGSVGRMPGFLPFFDPSGLVNINSGRVEEFSQAVVEENQKLLAEIEKAIGSKVLLKHINPHIARTLLKVIDGLEETTPVSQVLEDAVKNPSCIRNKILDIEATQESPGSEVYQPRIHPAVADGCLYNDGR